MADKNREIAMNVLEAVGRAANVSSVAHCMTRLRFVLKDQSIPKSKEIEKISGVVGTNVAGGQYQVIIGNNVGNVYKQLMTLEGISDLDTSNQEVTKKEKQNPVSIALDFISGCMSPLFPALVAGGLLKVLAVILGPTLTGVLATTSDTYVLMSALADVPFYFLPILVAFNASKKLNCNTSLAVMVASVLIYPDVISLLGTDKATHLFGVIPVIHGNYVSSIIPAMLAVILFKYVEIGIDKFTPEWSKNILNPFLSVVISAPITLCVLAPLGGQIGNGLQFVINTAYGFAPWLAMAVFAGFMPFIVMTGMHWAFLPTALMGLANVGFDIMLLPAMLASNIAQAGATFGAAAKSKDSQTRQMAIPAGISALLAGVTEPAMYGITLKLKKPMIAACISAGVGGFIMGLFKLKAYAYATPCLTAIVQFIAPDGNKNIIVAGIVAAVSFIGSFVLSFILTKDEKTEEENEFGDIELDEFEDEPEMNEVGQVVIEAPIKGEVISLAEVKDQTFASGLLGDGFAIVPSEGKVYAPFDGVCENIFDTLHALGLKSKEGVELLIHVGLETVTLGGKPFTAHVKAGQQIKKGDLLLEFDIDEIKKAGCETQTPVIVSNAEEFGGAKVENDTLVIGG